MHLLAASAQAAHVHNHLGMAGELAMVHVIQIAFLENKLGRQRPVGASIDWLGPACRY